MINEVDITYNIQTSPVPINLTGGNNIENMWFLVGTEEGEMYLVDWNGSVHDGWPYYTGTPIKSTPIVADLDCDGTQDVIFGSNDAKLHGVSIDGSNIPEFPINCHYGIKSPPAIIDADGDSDYEIAFGTSNNVVIIDYKDNFQQENVIVPMYRYNLQRTGYILNPQWALDDEPPVSFKNNLMQNYPNPLNGFTTIAYSLKNQNVHNARIEIYNILGQKVSQISDLSARF